MAKIGHYVSGGFRDGVRRVRRRLFPYSDYDRAIPPEIYGDEFYEAIRSLAATAPVKTILEIGSSTGEGSTRAFVQGIHQNPARPLLFCMELSRARFEALARRYAGDQQVKCYNLTSVPLDCYPTEGDVKEFYNSRPPHMNRVPLREVLRWLRQDLHYLNRLDSTPAGIRIIKEENGVDRFGMVLIDGSEFTGAAELDEVYGADIIMLDDTTTFKNHHNFERLRADPSYRLRAANDTLRNGYAVFERDADAPATAR